jgi:hypothetical protein
MDASTVTDRQAWPDGNARNRVSGIASERWERWVARADKDSASTGAPSVATGKIAEAGARRPRLKLVVWQAEVLARFD